MRHWIQSDWMTAMLAWLLLALAGTAWATAESPTTFCWKETWVTDASKTVIPDKCGANQERNGLFCYEKCRAGYTSNRIDGCVQNCPAGATDDGLFCGWPSYKAAEYPIWDERRCKQKHSTGCWKSGALWVENCKAGFKHVLGFCEKKDINCQAMGLKGDRIANSCTKNFYTRAPQQAGCPAGTEFSAGLCYASCGATADRVGFVCWGKCPAGWVNCGMGCAKSESDCRDNVTDQIVSVVDAVASSALLVGSLGASAAGKNIMSKAAWKGIKKIGKVAATDVLKTTLVGTVVQAPGNIGKIANGTMDYIWDVGAIEDNTVMTDIEKQHAIAKLALDSVSLIDPSGVVGVVSAYTKPVCKDIAAARPAAPPTVVATAGATAAVAPQLHSLAREGQTLNQDLQKQKEAEIAALIAQAATTKDANAKKAIDARVAVAQKDLAQIKRDLANARKMQSQAGKYQNLPKPAAAPAVAAAPAPTPAGGAVCAPKTAPKLALDTNYYYRLTTQWQGDGKSLDIVNDQAKNTPALANSGNFSGQFWKLTPLGDGHYRLTTQWQGDGKSLDIVNDGKNNNRPVLGNSGNYSGQMWKISPSSGGFHRLTTKWKGDCEALDIINDGRNNSLILGKGANVSGQAWKLTKTNVRVK